MLMPRGRRPSTAVRTVETHGVDPNRARGQAQSAIIEAPVEARILETAAAFVHGEGVSDDHFILDRELGRPSGQGRLKRGFPRPDAAFRWASIPAPKPTSFEPGTLPPGLATSAESAGRRRRPDWAHWLLLDTSPQPNGRRGYT
jgi:hypothetical protein